jgi:hypothetical protein
LKHRDPTVTEISQSCPGKFRLERRSIEATVLAGSLEDPSPVLVVRNNFVAHLIDRS